MRYSFVLTVAAGKKIIAQGLMRQPQVQAAKENGQILLKGGTTVSAVAEELGAPPLSISGRLTPAGFRTAAKMNTGPGWLLLHGGAQSRLPDLRSTLAAAKTMVPGDVVITGANLIDHKGRSALLLGSPLGGERVWVINMLAAEGIPVFVAAGLEKLCFSVPAAVAAGGRQKIDISQGMAVGLLPLNGQLFTEIEALSLLAEVRVTVIGRGGIAGAEGGTAFLVEGAEDEVKKIILAVAAVEGAVVSGVKESLTSCERGGGHCLDHLGCSRSRGQHGRHC